MSRGKDTEGTRAAKRLWCLMLARRVEALGVAPADLARQLGVATSALQTWLKGNHAPPVPMRIRVEDVLQAMELERAALPMPSHEIGGPDDAA